MLAPSKSCFPAVMHSKTQGPVPGQGEVMIPMTGSRRTDVLSGPPGWLMMRLELGREDATGEEDGLLAGEVHDVAHDLGTVGSCARLEARQTAVGVVPDQSGLHRVGLFCLAEVGDVVRLEAEGGPLLGDEGHVLVEIVVHVELGALLGRVEDGDGGCGAGRHGCDAWWWVQVCCAFSLKVAG